MPFFIEDTLITGTCLLQSPLQSAGTHVQTARNILKRRPMPCQPFLYGSPDKCVEGGLLLRVIEFSLKLGSKHVQKIQSRPATRKCMVMRVFRGSRLADHAIQHPKHAAGSSSVLVD